MPDLIGIPAGSDRWRLDGRVALVTGASAGLGGRFVKVLHGAGAYVVATARRAFPPGARAGIPSISFA